MGLEVVEALTPCTKQPQKQDVRFRQTTAAMLEVLTYTPSIAEACTDIERRYFFCCAGDCMHAHTIIEYLHRFQSTETEDGEG